MPLRLSPEEEPSDERSKTRAGAHSPRCAAAFAVLLTACAAHRPADHADSPSMQVTATDLADTYAFLDPTDNSKVVLVMTSHGFIVPGEAVNSDFSIPWCGTYSRSKLRAMRAGPVYTYKLLEENRHHYAADGYGCYAVRRDFHGSTTVRRWRARRTLYDNYRSRDGVSFFAGETDDPFFFTFRASRFRASVLAGAPTDHVTARA